MEGFYKARTRTEVDESDVLVISADAKGIVMRPDSLHEQAAKAAAAATNKLATRLSKGEKRNRKRMAEIGALYDVAPVPRTPHPVMAAKAEEEHPPEAPKAKNKWLTASVIQNAAEVVGRLFDESDRRDPAHMRRWVALVDRNIHQIDRTGAEAKARETDVTIVVDLVLSSSTCGHQRGASSPNAAWPAEVWVRDRALSVLEGRAREVASGIYRRATAEGLATSKRKKAY